MQTSLRDAEPFAPSQTFVRSLDSVLQKIKRRLRETLHSGEHHLETRHEIR